MSLEKQILSKYEIDNAMLKLSSNWSIEDDKLQYNKELKDFNEAVDLFNEIVKKAEEADHHPDILVHGWNKVKITLYTHEVDGLTKKDIELARQIDSID